MAPYPETETMTLKRIEVAIKKRDWSLLSEGLVKIREKFDINHRWEHYEQWRELLLQAEEAKLPDELWRSFCSTISKILGNDVITLPQEQTPKLPLENRAFSSPYQQPSIAAEKQEPQQEAQQQLSLSEPEKKEEIIISTSFPLKEEVAEQKSINSVEKSSRESIAVFYNEDIEENDMSLISSYRNGLNLMIEKNNDYFPQKSWFENLSYLVSSLNKPNSQMIEFLHGIKDVKIKGAIISSGYSSSVVQTMLKSGINFGIPGFRESDKSENCIKYTPLGGLINSYICPSCGSKSLKTGSHFDAVVGCCKKCAGMIYPDIYDINSSLATSSPKMWYNALNSMINSKVWVMINPPYHSKTQVEEFLSYAINEAANLQRVYIIAKAETGSYYRYQIEEKHPSVVVKDQYPSVSMFMGDFANIELEQKTPALV